MGFIFCASMLNSQVAPCANLIQQSSELPSTLTREQNTIVPVVFHIVYRTEEQNIEEEIIKEQMAFLNADFNLANQDLDKVPQEAIANLGNVGIDFKLAEIDPEGKSTNGIIRVQTEEEKIGNTLNSSGVSWIKQSDYGGSDPWPIDEYLNIWIGERTISIGYTIAMNTLSEDLIGIVINYQSIGQNGRTLTHETGHFLGLLHPWGNFTGCDGEDDGISDTPFQAFPDFNCEPIQSCGIVSKTANFMDFSADECLLYFTKEQAVRMQGFLRHNMPQLIDSDDCFPNNLPETGVKICYNPAHRSIDLYFAQEQENVNFTLYSINGQLIKQGISKSEYYINISTNGIPVGVYVLNLEIAGQLTAHKIFNY